MGSMGLEPRAWDWILFPSNHVPTGKSLLSQCISGVGLMTATSSELLIILCLKKDPVASKCYLSKPSPYKAWGFLPKGADIKGPVLNQETASDKDKSQYSQEAHMNTINSITYTMELCIQPWSFSVRLAMKFAIDLKGRGIPQKSIYLFVHFLVPDHETGSMVAMASPY